MAVAWLSVADDGVESARLVEMVSRAAGIGAGGGGVRHVLDSSGAFTAEPDGERPPEGTLALVRLDVNGWRRADPDRFEPGPMNALLGAFGVADARRIRIAVSGERIVARWERRRDDPATGPRPEQVLAHRTEVGKSEVWVIQGLGLGGFIAGAAQAGLALEPGERSPSDRAFADAWLRGRGELLRSLDRAAVRTELVITPDLLVGLAFRFDPAVRAESLTRSSLRIAPEGVSAVHVAGRVLRPAFRVAMTQEGAVVVVSPSERDAEGVVRAIGGEEETSGRDGP